MNHPSGLDNYWVSTNVIRSLVNWGVESGIPRADLLSAASTSDAQLNAADGHCQASHYAALLTFIETRMSDDLCGFRFGMAAEPDRWGVLGHIMTSCNTLGEALFWQQRYQRLVGNIGNVHVHSQNDSIRLAWQTDSMPPHHVAEEVMAGWVRFARWVTGTEHGPRVVHHRHTRETVPEMMQRFYQAEVRFGSTFNGLEFPQSFMQLPLKQPNSDMIKVMDGYAQHLLSVARQSPDTLISRLRQLIVRHLPNQGPGIDQVARQLCVSRRTLQRRLEAQDTTFREFVDQVRQEQAEHYLQTSLRPNLTELALTLGFNSQSSLTRAFQRWTGQTPSEYLAQL